MNRIEQVFKNKKPFNAYLTAGDGGIDYFIDCALALIEGGVDVLEIGFPFSDPVADGPVIQRAHHRALEQGVKATALLEIGRRLRKVTDVPMILFSYYNPLLQKGDEYLRQLKTAGFDGILVVDLTVPAVDLESEPFFKAVKEASLIPILLATPSTNATRLSQIGKMAQGFLYYVSQKGTTGVRSQLADDYSRQMTFIRKQTHLPIVAGFGIADRKSAKAALEYADGFVVGSAIAKMIEEKADPSEIKRLAESIDPRG